MARSALEALGATQGAAQRMMNAFEEVDREMLVEKAGLHDVNVPVAENEAFIAKVNEMRDTWDPQLKGRMLAAA